MNRYLLHTIVLTGLLLAACAGQPSATPPADLPDRLPGQGNDNTPTSAGGGDPAGIILPEVTPAGIGEPVGTVESGVVYPEDPSQAGLALYPDEPVETIPIQSASVTYVVEHRTALDGKEIIVQGVIVATLLGEKACPPDREMCAQPSIFLADFTDPNRDPFYDLRVLVSESEVEADYPIGEVIEIRIVVSGSNVAVIATRI